MYTRIYIHPLEWDSVFLGLSVAKVDIREAYPTAEFIQRECARTGVSLLYIYVYAEGDVAVAKRLGANKIDERITLTRSISSCETVVEVAGGFAVLKDRRDLLQLAWQSAELSRFKKDPRLPPDSWRELYRIWIDKSLDGRMADAILVERDEQGVAGMITVSVQNGIGKIGLFAVDARARGRGLGSQLLHRASSWFAIQGCHEATVVTQGDNEIALKSYRNAGYTIKEAVSVFHWWRDDDVGKNPRF